VLRIRETALSKENKDTKNFEETVEARVKVNVNITDTNISFEKIFFSAYFLLSLLRLK